MSCARAASCGAASPAGRRAEPWQASGVGLDETWEWDGTDWSLRTTATTPANSWQRCMAYDLATRQVLLFGGGPARDELWTYEPTHRATVTALGVGCAGSLGVPALTTANTRPWLGQTLTITVAPTPATGAALVSGLGTTGPIPLQPIGLPGCNAYVTLDSIVFAAASGGAVTWSLPVPNQPGLLGFEWHQQAAVLDPAATGGLAVSNAMTLRVGGL